MPNRISGTVDRTYFTSPKFSAGVLLSDTGDRVRFRGPFCANEGDLVTLVGRWKVDPKYGPQFAADSLSYELPKSPEGLVQYLAKHPAFVGIGEATARKIVAHAASAAHLDRLIRQDIDELHRELRIRKSTLESLREAWIAHSADNEIRSYLASFGLTHHQMETLLQTFGNSVVGVLRADPYQLIRYVKGYGVKKVDKIARAMGTPKDHCGRIEAGLLFIVGDELCSGHTWTAGADLLDKANDLLLLDTLDSRDVIRQAAERLLQERLLVADGNAVTTPWCLETERFIQSVFDLQGWADRPLAGIRLQLTGLKDKQAEAYRAALRYGIVVISGGAGTGKTYVLARLAMSFQDSRLRVALCSPTGKAAKRIEESLRAQGLDLEAKTIHRLLEYDGHEFHRESLSQPCNDDDDADPGYDVVIVDEVSMVDVPLMAELLRRIDFTRTRLILVGDHNQLPPVGPGNVLRDVIQHNLVPTVILDEVVRQAGVLKTNSMAVLSGAIAPTAVDDPAWSVVDVFQDPQQIQVYLRELVLRKIPDRLHLDPINDVQIITPTHIGPLGTKAVNQMMQRLLHGEVARKFAVADKVIQTVNDYGLGVMNGTIGRVVEIDPGPGGGYWIDFDGCGVRHIKDEQVLNVQLAYALTAHKAQGSEFPCVVVLCHKSHYFADRNWLYTAVTRAARYCILMGDRWGLRNAVKKNNTIRRRTFLNLWASSAEPASPLEVPA
ncbi:MAG: AAA family ATPase [Planctomycetales bacterium]|nr:AAA family ATPase [Planctomycetales bacterium]